MFNSEFTQHVARSLVQRLGSQATESELWQAVLGRSPTEKECKLLDDLLQQFPDRESGLITAASSLMNTSEFVFVD